MSEEIETSNFLQKKVKQMLLLKVENSVSELRIHWTGFTADGYYRELKHE